MGFLLYIIGAILFLPLTFLDLLVVIYKNIKTKDFFQSTNDYFFEGAEDLDKYANWKFKTLWNVMLKTKGGYDFGNIEETISSALGKNQRDNTLSIVGWIVVIILYIIDIPYWFKGGHCMNSINNKI